MKRISVEDLWKIQRPSGVSLAPDGARAVVSLSSYSMKENRSSASLWLLSTTGGRPRVLTTSGEKDGQPAWSPDGSKIAFVLCAAVGIGVSRWFARLKADKHPAFALHWLYWNLPATPFTSLRATPPSHVRRMVG